MAALEMPMAGPVGAADDDCRIGSPVEIASVLRDVIRKRALVTLHFDEGRRFIVTALLDVNPEFEELICDRGADEAANAALLDATRITAVTVVDHIKVQFTLKRAHKTQHGGFPAFRMRLPASLVRLQRRQAYRVRLPSSMHAQCRVARDAPRDALELQIIDLSVGGIAMACNAADWQAQIGEHLAGCRIGLPDAHGFDVELEVRNVTPLRDGKSRVRVGCQFVNLPGATAADVQRLILHVERATHR